LEFHPAGFRRSHTTVTPASASTVARSALSDAQWGAHILIAIQPDGSFSVTRQASFVGIGAVTGLTDADEQKLGECGQTHPIRSCACGIARTGLGFSKGQ